MTKSKMANVMLEIFVGLLLGMSLDVLTFKVRVLTTCSDSNF